MEGYAFVENERLSELLKLEQEYKNQTEKLEDEKVEFIRKNAETIIFKPANSPFDTIFKTRYYLGKDEFIKKLVDVNKNLYQQIDILNANFN